MPNVTTSLPSVVAVPPTAPAVTGAPPKAADDSPAWQTGAFSFADILDTLNPLQHIPIVNKIYRAITGDEIGVAPKIGGGILFGGVIGLIVSAIDSVVEETTGSDTSDHLVAFLQSGTIDADGTGDDGGTGNGIEGGTLVANITGDESEIGGDLGGTQAFIARSDERLAKRHDTQVRLAAVSPTTPPTAMPPTTVPPTTGPETTRRAETPGRTGQNAPRTIAAETPRARRSFAQARARIPSVTASVIPSATPRATPYRPLTSSVPLNGVRGAPGARPMPRMMAAQPHLVTAAQKGSGQITGQVTDKLAGRTPGPISGTPPGAWVEMMQAARGSSGAPGLAGATIARALASYGAGGNQLPLADIARAVRR